MQEKYNKPDGEKDLTEAEVGITSAVCLIWFTILAMRFHDF